MSFVVVIRFDQGLKPLQGTPPKPQGLLGSSVWQGPETANQNILLLHFESQDAALEHSRNIIEFVLDNPQRDLFPPDQISHVVLAEHHGALAEAMPPGGYMVMGTVHANPGFGDDVLENFIQLGYDLRTLSGYAGQKRGQDSADSDKVWFFSFWDAMPTFPIPKDLVPTTHVYQKIM